MGYDIKHNGSDFTIVTDLLLYSVFATHYYAGVNRGYPSRCVVRNTKPSSINQRI